MPVSVMERKADMTTLDFIMATLTMAGYGAGCFMLGYLRGWHSGQLQVERAKTFGEIHPFAGWMEAAGACLSDDRVLRFLGIKSAEGRDDARVEKRKRRRRS